MTVMMDAIEEMWLASLGPELSEPLSLAFHLMTKRRIVEGVEVREWRAILNEENNGEDVLTSTSSMHYEEAVALMFQDMTIRFEEHKKKLLENLDAISARHRGTLRAAKKKTKEA